MSDAGQQAGGVVDVLVVNDDSAIRSMLKEILCEEGYAVTTAGDGQQALAILRQPVMPRLVLLDDRMPVMGGIEVLQELAAEPELAKRTACVFLTARPQTEVDELTDLLSQVNASVLHHGFNVDRLLRVVEEAATRLPAL